MQNTTDRGGWPTEGPIDQADHPKMDWQQRPLALYDILWGKGLIRGAIADSMIRSRWPDGWSGMYLKVGLPLELTQAQFDGALASMMAIAETLERAD